MSLNAFFEERLEIARQLTELGEISLLNTFNTDLPRVFVVAAASYFEALVTDHLRDFFAETSGDNAAVAAFMNNRALFRNYHSLFAWSDKSVNGFFKIFGAPCLEHYKLLLKANDWLDPSAKAFLKLGEARNLLVHGNFALHSPSMTASDIQQRFEEAARFVEAIPRVLRLEDLREPATDGSFDSEAAGIDLNGAS
jgi:hypothetical protein